MLMPYVTGPNAMSTAGPTYEYVFTGNGIQDVDPSLAGNQQPMLFDQMMALYADFYVHGSTCKVTTHPISSASANAAAGQKYIVPMYTATSLIATVGVNGTDETRLAKKVTWGNLFNKDVTFRHRMTSRRMLSAPGRTSYDASGSNTANPTEMWYWHLIWISADATTALLANLWTCKLVYDVEFSRRVPNTIS